MKILFDIGPEKFKSELAAKLEGMVKHRGYEIAVHDVTPSESEFERGKVTMRVEYPKRGFMCTAYAKTEEEPLRITCGPGGLIWPLMWIRREKMEEMPEEREPTIEEVAEAIKRMEKETGI